MFVRTWVSVHWTFGLKLAVARLTGFQEMLERGPAGGRHMTYATWLDRMPARGPGGRCPLRHHHELAHSCNAALPCALR